MAHFEDLVMWKEAKALTITIYRLMKSCKDYGFRDQIQRASVSIMNNIAEGSDSGSDAINIRFLNIAKGSCSEVRSMLYFALHWAIAPFLNKKNWSALPEKSVPPYII